MIERAGGVPFAAIIFDFDLTLADSSAPGSACVAHALQGMGFDAAPFETIRRTVGLSLEATLEVLTGSTDPEVQVRFKDLFVQHADEVMVEQTEMLSGIPRALSELRNSGMRLAIVSTKYRYRIEAILDRHGERQNFDVIIGGEDTSAQKPDPEGLERAIEALGLAAHSALYVGDHRVDAEAAMQAAVPFVPVLTGTTPRDDFLRFPFLEILDSVSELPGFLSEGRGSSRDP